MMNALVMAEELDIERLIEAHQAALWRYARLLGAGDALAEDLVQETFLAVMQKPFEQRGARETAAYLRTVARNLFLKSTRHAPAQSLDESAEANALWERYVDDERSDAHIAALRECIAALQERARLAIELRYQKGLAREDVAAAMGMEENGVKTLIQRARASLKECVEKKIGSDL